MQPESASVEKRQDERSSGVDPGSTREPTRRTNRRAWRDSIGPGVITGAADDDPSGIATYSQAGAQFGFSLLWTTALTTPLMIGIQLASARIGWVTGRGLTANLNAAFPRWIAVSLVLLLMVANTINIAADLAAMGDALQLLIGGPQDVYSAGFGVLSVALTVYFPYRRYVRYLKYLTLSLFAYVAVVLTVRVPWGDVARSIAMPDLRWDSAYWMVVVAVLGTTISPYLFFWQASQEVEGLRAAPDAAALRTNPAFVAEHLYRIKLDTVIGMVFSNAIAFAIMLSAAVTLHAHGVTQIGSSAQAAEALRPFAGDLTFVLFSLGIVGTGMLAVPILAGSAAYAGAELLDVPASIERKLAEAREFYGIVAVATAAGAALDFTSIDPMQALLASAVVNGIIAVPIMAALMVLASRASVMGELRIGLRTRVLGWAATAVMAAAGIALIVSLFT